jgi:hypothetical protein
MKSQYEFTVADLADVTRRAVARSQSLLLWRWRSRVIQATVFSLIVYWIIEASVVNRVVGAAISFITVYVVLWMIRTRPQSAPYVDYYRQKLRGDGPCLFEIEINSDALVTRQLGEESRHEWSSITSIREAEGGLEIDLRRGSLIFVRDNGFSSAEARSTFLRQAREWAVSNRRSVRGP